MVHKPVVPAQPSEPASTPPVDEVDRTSRVPLVGARAATSLQEVSDVLTAVEARQDLDNYLADATSGAFNDYRKHIAMHHDLNIVRFIESTCS